MQTNDIQPVKRGRGRPRKVPLSPTGSYNGPTLDTILAMSDQQVQIAFDEIGVEPSSFRWMVDDDQSNISHWHDYGIQLSDADRLKSQPKGVEGMKVLKQSALEIHQVSLKMELLAAHVQKWIAELSDSQLIAAVESLDNTTLSVSEKRYMKLEDMRDRVQQLVWPTIIASSKLHVPVINPLGGT